MTKEEEKKFNEQLEKENAVREKVKLLEENFVSSFFCA